MQTKLELTQIWAEDDLVEVRIDVCDGVARFTNQIYVQRADLVTTAIGLEKSLDQANGRYKFSFGNFSPEYAAAAFHADLHCSNRGQIKVKVCARSELFLFDNQAVASQATLYFNAEPSQLDDFIAALRAMRDGQRDNAILLALPRDF